MEETDGVRQACRAEAVLHVPEVRAWKPGWAGEISHLEVTQGKCRVRKPRMVAPDRTELLRSHDRVSGRSP